jgi:hypothetical protein
MSRSLGASCISPVGVSTPPELQGVVVGAGSQDPPVRSSTVYGFHHLAWWIIACSHGSLDRACPVGAHPTLTRSSVIEHHVRVHPSSDRLPREDQLTWKLASVATGTEELDPAGVTMAVNRVIGNASVAVTFVLRRPVAVARAQATAHGTGAPGASVFGTRARVSPEWAARANGTAVRELDFHDTYLAAGYSHPGDNIPPPSGGTVEAACLSRGERVGCPPGRHGLADTPLPPA